METQMHKSVAARLHAFMNEAFESFSSAAGKHVQ